MVRIYPPPPGGKKAYPKFANWLVSHRNREPHEWATWYRMEALLVATLFALLGLALWQEPVGLPIVIGGLLFYFVARRLYPPAPPDP